jgi:heme-degrading monooxygenase HmoA
MMFVRVTHMEIAPENWSEALQRFRTTVIAELEKRPGFLRTILTGDATTGRATTITMWRSAENEQESQSAGQDPVIAYMAGLFSGDAATSGYPELFEREF